MNGHDSWTHEPKWSVSIWDSQKLQMILTSMFMGWKWFAPNKVGSESILPNKDINAETWLPIMIIDNPMKILILKSRFSVWTANVLNQFSAFILKSCLRQIVARLSPIWFLYFISRDKSASLKSLKIAELRLFDKRSWFYTRTERIDHAVWCLTV